MFCYAPPDWSIASLVFFPWFHLEADSTFALAVTDKMTKKLILKTAVVCYHFGWKVRPDWLVGNEETGACWSVEMGGVLFFCCFFKPLHDSLATERDCSGNDGADKLFWGIKNLSSWCFLVAIKFFSHFIGKCQCKYAVCFEMKSREEN